MKNSILSLGVLIIIFLGACIVINFYPELAIGLIVGLIFGFVAYFYGTQTEKNQDEIINRISYYLFFGIEFSFFAFMCTGLIFRYQLGNAAGIVGIGFGVLLGFLHKKINETKKTSPAT
jgi:predicted membrane protein